MRRVLLLGLLLMVGLLPGYAPLLGQVGDVVDDDMASSATSVTPTTLSVTQLRPEIGPENYNTGGLVTHPGGGIFGADESRLQTQLGMAIIGFDASALNDTRIADDFTVTEPWALDWIKLYAYQTGADYLAAPSITSASLRIWDGPPGAVGSSIIFGDTVTNRLLQAAWANVFRTCQGFVDSCSPGSTVRPVQALLLDTVDGINPLTLAPGTYWWDVQLAGSVGLPVPRLVPLSAVDAYVSGNAQRFIIDSWLPVLDDGGLGVAVGFPMEISYMANATGLFDRISPVGTVSSALQTFEVTDSGQEWLRMTIAQALPTGDAQVVDAWYAAADYCDSLKCVLLAPILSNGSYKWYMQGWTSSSGLTGQDMTTFELAVPPVGYIQLQSPLGDTPGAPIAIAFGQDLSASWYHVYISGPDGFVFNQWFATGDVCDSSSGRCLVEAPPMDGGGYQLWLGGWGAAGFGPYSATPFLFTVPSLTAPGAIVTISPLDAGNVAAGTANLTWAADPNALWYHIILDGPGTSDVDAWVHAATVCPDPGLSNVCVYDVSLTAGSYTWTMEAWGVAGFGPMGSTSFDAA